MKKIITLILIGVCLLVGCGNTPDNSPPKGSKVEITTDNFHEYFEEFEYTDWRENAFGETTGWCASKYYKIKDEYVDRIDPYQSELAIQVDITYAPCNIDIDFNNKTWSMTKKDDVSDDCINIRVDETVKGGYLIPDEDDDEFRFFGVRIAQINTRGEISKDEDLSSVEYGFEGLIDYNITRVKGIILFK